MSRFQRYFDCVMSKKQIKQRYEEQERARLEQLSTHLEKEDEDVQGVQRSFNKFALFQDMTEDKPEEVTESDDDDVPQIVSTSSKRANKKKNKKKKKQEKVEEETEEQLLEKAVVENAEKADCMNSDEGPASLEVLFKVNPRSLDAAAEWKKALGITLKDGAQGSTNTHRNHNKSGAFGRLVKSKGTWPPIRNLGLSMVMEPTTDNTKYFNFVHNSNYESLERMYWHAEDVMDVGGAQEILYTTGYHLNSLLMIANMYTIQEDVTQAMDLIERGILFSEQFFNSRFEIFNWHHRISYLHYENRAFYLLLHRHMLNVAAKRCFETAFNFGRLIFKLDPIKDDLSMLLMLDTLALKAKNYDWLIKFYEAAKNWKNLHLLPNMCYSVSLAQFLSGNVEKATTTLTDALILFPTVVTELLDVLQVQADSVVETHEFFSTFAAAKESDGLKLMLKIYTKHSFELWKEPATFSWLETTTRTVASNKALKKEMEAGKKKRSMYDMTPPLNIRRLAALLGLSESFNLTDPLPPKATIARYKRSDAVTRPSGSGWLSFLHSLDPSYQPTGEETEGSIIAEVERLFGLLGFQRPQENQENQGRNNEEAPPQ